MILRTSIVLLSLFVFVELCLRTIPPEEVFISSTGANLPTDDPETEEPEEPTDAPVTNAPVTDAPVTDAPVTNVPTELCTTCDINDIAPELMEPGATSFTSTETAAAGECKKTTVVCQRTDTKICDSVTMSAQSASGSNSIADSSTSNSVTSQLTCSEDGTYSWNAITGITKLSCDFVNCIAPLPDLCTSCNIDDIAPQLLEPGATSFTSTETAAAGECKKTTVVCQRTDAKTCDSVTMSAQSASGSNSVADSSTSNSVTSQLTCSEDGTYSWNAITGITKLSCDFVNCIDPLPCATCDVKTIAPTMPLPAGQVFDASETTGPGGCKGATVKCSRSDGQTCTKVSIEAQGTGGSATLSGTMDSNEAEASLSCQNDGTYATSVAGGITSLTCVYDGCALPCTKCDITAISPPTPMPSGTTFDVLEGTGADGCKQTAVKCSRSDDQVCTSVFVEATSASGTSTLSSSPNTNEAEATLTCQNDGTYSFNSITGITGLSCGFTGCSRPCSTCDISAILPASTPELVYLSQDTPPVDQCKQTAILCARNDVIYCSGTTILADGLEIESSNIHYAETLLVCGANGKYGFPGVTDSINQISCVFEGCCTNCNLLPSSISNGATPSLQVSMSETVDPNGCAVFKLTCTMPAVINCAVNQISALTPGGPVVVSTESTPTSATAYITCDLDNKYKTNGLTGLTNFVCDFACL